MMDSFKEGCIAVPSPSRTGTVPKSFWQKDDPVLDPSGRVIKGGFWKHQREWWTLPNFIKGLIGGYASGKTLIGSKRAITLALQNAPCPIAAISPSFRQARNTTISTISGLLAGKQTLYGSKLWWRFLRGANEFQIRFHGREARILILSGDNPDSLRGPNLAAAWIDEPFIQDEEVFLQMLARVRHPDARTREILLTGTPEGISSWGYDIAIGEDKDKYDIGIVHASTRANLALPPEYVQRLLRAYDAKTAEAYIEGKFVNLSEGQVYYGFDPTIHVQPLEADGIPEGVELGCGMDFNVNPMAFTLFWRAGSHIHFFEEFELPNADTEYACSTLYEKWVQNRTRGPKLEWVYPDASGSARKTAAPGGKTDFWYIKAAGFKVRAHDANPKRKDRYNAVNGKLKPAEGKPSMTVSPRCKKLIKYLSLYSHDDMDSDEQKALSHLLDAMSYPVEYLFPVHREIVTVSRMLGA